MREILINLSFYFLKHIYELYGDILPSIRELNFITNFEELNQILEEVLVSDQAEKILNVSSPVFDKQILKTHGESGKLASQFISEYIENKVDK